MRQQESLCAAGQEAQDKACPVPVTLHEFREWQRQGRFRAIREGCGISGNTIALALGINHSAIYAWEAGRVPVSSVHWEKYMRVIKGLMNHLETDA